MQRYTLEEFASMLIRHFHDYRPRVTYDTTDKGERTMEFLISNPHDLRFSVSLQCKEIHRQADTCTLWFGQAKVTGTLDPEMAVSAISTIVHGELIAILRYKNEDAYDNHRPMEKQQWLYQLTDDEDDDSAALEKMEERLSRPPSLFEKLSGNLLGVFEIFSWSEAQVLKR